MRSLAILAVSIIITATSVYGGDSSFSSVVKHLQSNYSAQKQGLYGAGFLARIAVKIVRPAGVKGLRFTILRDLEVGDFRAPEFSAFLGRSISPRWQPMIRQYSRRADEWTWIYVQPDGDDIKLLIIARQRRDAFVAEARINPDKLSAFINDPRILGIPVGDRRGGRQITCHAGP